MGLFVNTILIINYIKNIGPGTLVAAAFIGPGTITTATLSGASYGYTLIWAVVFSIISTIILQEMSSRLAVIGKIGLGEAIRNISMNKYLKLFISILVVAAIFIGNSAYEAGNITGASWGFESERSILGIGLNKIVILIIGVLAFAVLFSAKYKSIEKFLIVLVVTMGIVFIITALIVSPNYVLIIQNMFVPSIPKGSLILIIGLIGTTVVPYNLFLHASASKNKWKSKESLRYARFDTVFSIVLGGIITMCILISSAVAFEGSEGGFKNISELSNQLSPILGSWSESFLSLGFLAAGLSSSITAPLAAAYATSEIFGWKSDLKNYKFKVIWFLVLIVGLVFSLLDFKPATVILFSQFVNGLLLPIIAIYLIWVLNNKRLLGNYSNSLISNILGILVVLVCIILGIKSIGLSTNLL